MNGWYVIFSVPDGAGWAVVPVVGGTVVDVLVKVPEVVFEDDGLAALGSAGASSTVKVVPIGGRAKASAASQAVSERRRSSARRWRAAWTSAPVKRSALRRISATTGWTASGWEASHGPTVVRRS